MAVLETTPVIAVGNAIKIHCADCIHARVGPGELCYCDVGEWYNWRLETVLREIRACKQYEVAEG